MPRIWWELLLRSKIFASSLIICRVITNMVVWLRFLFHTRLIMLPDTKRTSEGYQIHFVLQYRQILSQHTCSTAIVKIWFRQSRSQFFWESSNHGDTASLSSLSVEISLQVWTGNSRFRSGAECSISVWIPENRIHRQRSKLLVTCERCRCLG